MSKPRDVLTGPQIKFIECLLRGTTQSVAYKEAFPKSQKWTDRSAASAATALFARPHLQKYYAERLEQTRLHAAAKTEWTRERAIEMLSELAEKGMNELSEGKLTMSRIIAVQASAKELNLMHGYNITNVNNSIVAQVIISGEADLED
jgi:hypothetical protein